jgi:hypothetical protein
LLVNKQLGEWDAAALLKLMWEVWNEVFRRGVRNAVLCSMLARETLQTTPVQIDLL